MGFFDVFKRSAPPQRDKPVEDARPRERKSLRAAVSKGDVFSRMCGSCGGSYDHPRQRTPLLVIEVQDWELDLGGYCPVCRLHLCPTHVQLAVCGTVEILGTKHEGYERKCVTCQTTLSDGEGDDPDGLPQSMFIAT